MICIGVRDLSSTDITINDNFIGGSAPGCGGTAWTKTSASKNDFIAIQLYVGPTVSTTTSVQGNTIKNFSWSDAATSASSWTAIYAAGTGDINIGTVTGNTIGATTGNGSIYLYTKATSGNNYGIDITFCTGTVDCRNNTMGAITTTNSNSNYPNNFYGIHKSATAGTTTISNNTIGSTSTANSINAASVSGSNAQEVFGIYSEGTGAASISGNTISKLTNATNNPTFLTAGKIIGIQTTSGTNTISNNTVRDLTIANGNTAKDATASVIGIVQTSTTAAAQNVSGNTIYNLSNTYPYFASFAGAVTGLYYAGPATASTVSGNFIHSLSISSPVNGCGIYGMYINGGTTTYSNNIIRLGDNTAIPIYGIQESDGTNNYYFNTVYIGGAPAGSFYSIGINSQSNAARNFRNNLFINARSNNGGTGPHFAAAINTSSLTIDYNDYVASGSGGVLGFFGENCNTLTAIQTATGQDVHSLNTDPLFASAGGTSPSNYIPSASLPGDNSTGITTDYAGTTRAATPTMGAYEGPPASVTWTGTTNTDWNTPGNWSPANVPYSSSTVTIPATANNPFINQDISSPAVCNNLSIASSAVLTIAAGKALTVNGNLTNNNSNDGLILQSDDHGTGSLIHNSSNVAATVESYITGSATLTAMKYHFISIPTNYPSPTLNLFLGSYLYTLDATQLEGSDYGKWVNPGSSTSTPLSNSSGYMIYYPGPSHTYTFKGNLNNGDFPTTVIGHTGAYTYNLIPNPFPSAINWGEAAGWTKSAGIGGSIYIFTASTGNYTTLSGTAYIPLGQAFIVLDYNEASPSVTIKNAARVHSTQAFYKSVELNENRLVLSASMNNYYDETVVAFDAAATEGFDLPIDGMKLSGLADAPQLSTLAGGHNLSINTLPPLQNEVIVPIKFETEYSGPVTFNASGMESFVNNASIYLEDKTLRKMVNLRLEPVYNFSYQSGDATDRFNLRFNGTIGIQETSATVDGRAFVSDGRIYLDIPSMQGQIAEITVYNTLGQVIRSKNLMISSIVNLEASMSSGVYIVQASSADKHFVTKVINK